MEGVHPFSQPSLIFCVLCLSPPCYSPEFLEFSYSTHRPPNISSKNILLPQRVQEEGFRSPPHTETNKKECHSSKWLILKDITELSLFKNTLKKKKPKTHTHVLAPSIQALKHQTGHLKVLHLREPRQARSSQTASASFLVTLGIPCYFLSASCYSSNPWFVSHNVGEGDINQIL